VIMIDNYFSCDIEEFRKVVAKFIGYMDDGVNGESLNLAFRCVLLHYLNFNGNDSDIILASGLLEYAIGKFEGFKF
jgi:hypothetical protein